MRYQYLIHSSTPPRVELTDAGLYVRFQEQATVARTLIEREWPHVAVDLDENGRVIGIELVPAPRDFSIGQIPTIVQGARVGGLPSYRAEDVVIENLCAA